MAQHDYVIDNQSFPATRTDINNVLLAISSTNSGTSAPSTTYANQLWYDTSENKLYIRNEDNDAWIPLFLLDQSNDVAGTLATEIDVEDASGTDTAGTALTVKGGAGTGSGAGGSIVFQTADGGSSGSSVNSHATRVTITDDGKVGIGTASPSQMLHAKTTGSDYIFAESTSSSDNVGFRMKNGDRDWYILNDASGVLQFFDGTDNATHMRLTNDPYLRLSGGGIQFNGDTAAANALDDYEEGSWTPTYISTDGNLVVAGYSLQFGRYVKIGKMCQINGGIQTTGITTTGTGDVRIDGLPFGIANISGGFIAGSVGYSQNFLSVNPQAILGFPNTTAISLRYNASTDARSNMTGVINTSNMSGTNNHNLVWFSISYTVTGS